MSATLYLVRHGIAEAVAPDARDADRQLTSDGIRKLTRAAAGLKRLGVTPDVVLSSPLRRAEQTAALLAAALAPDVAVEVFPALAPGHAPAEVLQGLQAYRKAPSLMLVGHQPALGELAAYLLTRSSELAALPFKKGGVAAIRVTSVPPRAAGVLQWFVTPRQLRSMRRLH